MRWHRAEDAAPPSKIMMAHSLRSRARWLNDGHFSFYFGKRPVIRYIVAAGCPDLKGRSLLAVGESGNERFLTGMQANTAERRAMRRFEMRLPAVVRLEGDEEFHTETQNVSARGVFFYVDKPITAGTKLQITLTFPPHVTLTDAVRVRFFARVIRVENPISSVRSGVAAMIENYEFLTSNATPDILAAMQNGLRNTN